MHPAELLEGGLPVAEIRESAGQLSPQASRVVDHGDRLEFFGGLA